MTTSWRTMVMVGACAAALLVGARPVMASPGEARADDDRRPDPPRCAVSLTDLRARAVDRAGLRSGLGLRRRARLAGLIPDVSLRASRGQAWDDPFVGPRATGDGIAQRAVYDVRLSWQLDRLVFDPVEPSVVQSERTAARARLEIEDEVTVRYFRWRRAVLDAEELPGPREQLAVDETWAGLEALVGDTLTRGQPCENLRPR